MQHRAESWPMHICVAACCSVSQFVAVCSNVSHCGAAWCRKWAMGWLRLVGSLKLYVSLAKEPYKRDDILQKRLRGGQVFQTARHCKTLQYTVTHRGWLSTNTMAKVSMFPLTEEIKLKIFGSRDLTTFSLDLLSDRDSVHSRENLYENVGTPLKTCSVCIYMYIYMYTYIYIFIYTATHMQTLQHTSKHCNLDPNTATHCNAHMVETHTHKVAATHFFYHFNHISN